MRLDTKVMIVVLTIMVPGFAYSQKIDTKAGALDPDEKTIWYNAKDLGVEGKGWENTESHYDRLPSKAKGMVTEQVWSLSHSSSGMYTRFSTEAKSIKVRWHLNSETLDMQHMPATGVSGVDLYALDENGVLQYCNTGQPKDTINTASFSLPSSSEYVLYLPLYVGIKRLEIGIPRDASISKLKPLSLSTGVVFYGTSITQGGCASRPGMAATTITGRRLNVPVINLGFSGSGRMEIEMAELLAELNPGVYVLDCLWNMSPEMVSERMEPFILKLRESRSTTPILLVEDSNFENQPTLKGDIVRNIYAELKKRGDKNLYFLSNRNMLGQDRDATVDRVHLNDLGNFRQAEAFSRCLQKIIKKQK